MKIIIKNKENDYYNQELEVLKMNYDNVLARDIDTGAKLKFKKKDIKFKADNDYEKVIEKCSDLLKIKLNSKMSLIIYSALYEAINEYCGEKIKRMDIVKDNDRKIKKGLWEKRLLIAVNKNKPLEISVVGRNYSRVYDVFIKNVEMKEFTKRCMLEVEKLNNEKNIVNEKIKEFKKYTELKC